MKLRAEIEVPDDADEITIEIEKKYANWRRIYSREDRMKRTDLTDKCGSCKHFCPVYRKFIGGTDSLCYGTCAKGRADRTRTTPICKDYERRNK